MGSCKKPAQNVILDGLFVVIVVFILGLMFLVSLPVVEEINLGLNSSAETSQEALDTYTDTRSEWAPLFDNLFLLALVLFSIFVIISVFLIDTHPILFVISFILLIGVFVVAVLLANGYSDLASDPELSMFANEFPKISWTMDHILSILVSITTAFLIALFAKVRGG